MNYAYPSFKNMELRHLRYFVAIAETGSFSKASQVLFIAQPALSSQVQQLEEELGARLLDRSRRGVELTAAGKALLAEAKDILRHAGLLKRIVAAADEHVGGVVRMGFVTSSTHTILPRLVPKIRARHPGVELIVKEMTTSAQFTALLNGGIDLGIGRPPVTHSNIAIVAEMADSFCLAVPEKSPLAAVETLDASMLRDEPFIGFSRADAPAYYDHIINVCITAGFSPNIQYEAGTVYTMLDMVASGLGVSIAPASSVLFRQHGFVLKPIGPQAARAATSLALFQLRDDRADLTNRVAQEVGNSLAELEADILSAFSALGQARAV